MQSIISNPLFVGTVAALLSIALTLVFTGDMSTGTLVSEDGTQYNAVGDVLSTWDGDYNWTTNTYDTMGRLTEPFIEFFRYLPAPAFGALAVAVLGIENAPKIAIIFIGTFFGSSPTNFS